LAFYQTPIEPEIDNKFKRALFGESKKYPTNNLQNWLRSHPVYVLIPAYNEENSIGKTIKSVLEQDIPVKVIVIDDHSTDRTSQVAERYGIEVIRTPKNTGTKAQAQNFALKGMPRNGVVVTIDADTTIPRDAVRTLLAPCWSLHKK